ncbi:MAG: hypothetical protein QNJ89_08685 [Acidimicrobiia bacterium]|nr:hypothetical protein [Acidimicrobiia bacterium]
MRGILIRAGLPLSGTAIAVASVTALIIGTVSPNDLAGTVAWGGAVVFVVAMLLGAGRLIGVATLLTLAGGLIAATAANPNWIRLIVVACLWYLAAELGWEGIDRRDEAQRSAALNSRRINEVATVILLSICVAAVALATSSFAPVRSLSVVGVAVLGLLLTLGLAVRRVTDARVED